jgi:ABC-type uncharacterized transport system involved in gliding motility auxiliary subunit
MSPKVIWTGRVLGALGFLLGLVVAFRYVIISTPSDVFLGLGLSAIVMIAAWIYMDWDLIAAVSGRRGTRRQAGSWLMVLLGCGIAVLVNYVSYRHHWEHDITEGDIHSLSQQTLDVIEALEQEVQITGFYQQLDSTGEAFRSREAFDQLSSRYTDRSDLLTVQLIDQDVEPRAAIDRGVFQNGVVFVTCGEREERVIMPDENDLTNALIKATRGQTKVLYFVTGHGERDIRDSSPSGYSELVGKLEATGFEVKALELYRVGMVPADATAVVIGGPVTGLLETEVPLLRDYVERRGGGLMVMLEPETESGLEPLLAHWGIEVGQDLVVDLEGQAMVGDYSTIFADLGHHEITGELTVPAMLQQARTVSAAEGRFDVQVLLKSGRSAWAEKDLESMEMSFDAEVDEPGPLNLGAITEVARVAGDRVAGDRVAGDAEPSADDDSADGDAAEITPPPLPDLDDEDAEPGAPVIVFGDSDLASNGTLSLFGNLDLTLNSFSYMTRETDLITIRAREEADRPIHLKRWQVALVWVIAMPGMTILVMIGGVIAWFWRLAR